MPRASLNSCTIFRSAAAVYSVLLASHVCEGQIRFPGTSGKRPAPAVRPNNGGVDTRTQFCAQGSIFFAGSCHKEFTQGTPCPGTQWLVRSATDPAAGQCQPRPCPDNQLLWTLPGLPAKTCAPRTFGAGKCAAAKPNQRSFTDPEKGTGGCDCITEYVYWPLDDRCYKLFQRGPCAEGEVLIFDTVDKFLACQTNPCDAENFALWTDGQCFELETADPCPEDGTLLRVDPDTLALECRPLDLKQIITLSSTCPPGTKRDYNGTCSQTTFVGSGGNSGSCKKGFIRKPDGTCVKWFR